MTDTEAVAAALRNVSDPDIGGDVVSAGLVTDATVEGGTVTLDAELAGVDPAAAEEVVEAIRAEVLGLPGVERVRVEGENPAAAASDDVGLPADHVVAVASAKGGVGKSTVAASLARGLAERGQDVGLFDADIYGPNVPDLLDAEGPVTATENGRAAPVEAAGLELMSIGLIENDAPIAWRGAMAHEALLDLLGDAAWSDLDTLVIDLPPGTGDVVLTTLQDVPVDGVVLVTTPYPTAVGDTDRSATLFQESGVPILGAVVNMAGFTCPTCGDDHDLFGGDAVADLDAPVLAELPFDESLREPGGEVPPEIDSLGATVRERIDEAGFDVPNEALDVSGLPAGIRLELVTDEFAALEAGEQLWVVTDREPDSLLGAIGADAVGDGSRNGEHDGCECGRSGHGHRDGHVSEDGAVAEADVRQIGPREWAFRVQKGGATVHSPAPIDG